MSVESVMPSNHLILCRPLCCPQSFPPSGSFPMSQLFSSGGQSIGASATVLPMNNQDWFPLGLTDWISLQTRDSEESSSTTVWKHQFFTAQPSLWSHSHICTWLPEKALIKCTAVGKVICNHVGDLLPTRREIDIPSPGSHQGADLDPREAHQMPSPGEKHRVWNEQTQQNWWSSNQQCFGSTKWLSRCCCLSSPGCLGSSQLS